MFAFITSYAIAFNAPNCHNIDNIKLGKIGTIGFDAYSNSGDRLVHFDCAVHW